MGESESAPLKTGVFDCVSEDLTSVLRGSSDWKAS